MRAVPLALLALLLARAAAAEPDPPTAPTGALASHAPDGVIVGFSDAAPPDLELRVLAPGLAVAAMRAGEAPAAAAARIALLPGVRFAEPDFLLEALLAPNDLAAEYDMWGLRKMPAAWDVTTGAASADTTVCVVDTADLRLQGAPDPAALDPVERSVFSSTRYMRAWAAECR